MIQNQVNQIAGIIGSSTYATHSANVETFSTEPHIAPAHIIIGKLKLTRDEYEICMRHLLELTKREKPEEFI